MDSVFWLAATVVFIVAEAATTALVSVWFAVGAVAALVVSLFTGSLGVQLIVFAGTSAVALAVMVPLVARRRAGRKAPVTNGAALVVGRRGQVRRAIAPGELGRVHVDGVDYQARSETALPEGARCEVVAADGAVLTVAPVLAPAPSAAP